MLIPYTYSENAQGISITENSVKDMIYRWGMNL